MVRAGQLTKRVTLQRFQPLTNNFRPGGEWIDVAEMLVGLMPLSGRELANAQQVESLATHKVKTHYRGDVWPKMRLRMLRPGVISADTNNDSHYRMFNIESVLNVDEANRELELSVIEQISGPPEFQEAEQGDG
jgi:SPP1 family predicted phage head-tail adaptor